MWKCKYSKELVLVSYPTWESVVSLFWFNWGEMHTTLIIFKLKHQAAVAQSHHCMATRLSDCKMLSSPKVSSVLASVVLHSTLAMMLATPLSCTDLPVLASHTNGHRQQDLSARLLCSFYKYSGFIRVIAWSVCFVLCVAEVLRCLEDASYLDRRPLWRVSLWAHIHSYLKLPMLVLSGPVKT